MIRENSFE